MKFKSRIMRRYSCGKPDRIATKHRRPGMPQFPSKLAAEIAADRAHNRVETFKFLKKLKKLPKEPMTQAVLIALGLVAAGG